MSSKGLVKRCSKVQVEETRLEKLEGKDEKKEEAEVPRGDNRLAGRSRQEETKGRRPSSLYQSGMQKGTSKSGLEQVWREVTRNKKARQHFSQQENQAGRERGTGRMKRCIRRSSPRVSCSYSRRERQQQAEECRGPGPFYFFGGANGAEIVSSYCESRGWRRIDNRDREDFKLKWCETKSPANYFNFKEGEQLVYQIPNNRVLTTKIGLLNSLREYERVSSKVNHGQGPRKLKMKEFIPTTFRMDVKKEREVFFAQQEAGVSNPESHMWICKPTGLNQGRGIFLLKSPQDVAAFRLKLQHTEEHSRKTPHRQPQALIVQHYIQRPLLLRGKKFDVRSYLLIACTAPYMVFFRHGYVRLTCDLYDPSSNNLSSHLTNQYMQKKNPMYSQLKEDTVWSMESFNTYVNDKFQVAKGLPRDWVLGAFAKRMQQIMTQCFLAVKSKFDCRLGFFDLIGCDFMVDEDFKVWLLEMNSNPALQTNCKVLKEVIPSTVVETLDLTLEIFDKCRLKERILPLASLRDFVLLYNRIFPRESMALRSESNTNGESNQKSTKKTEPTGCKSGTEGDIGPSLSLDIGNSPASWEGRVCSKSDHFLSTFPAPSLCQQIHPSLHGTSQLPSSFNTIQAVRNKNPRSRDKLELSKYTIHYYSKGPDEAKDSKVQKKTATKPLSPPGITVCGFAETTLFPPHAGPPLCGKECEAQFRLVHKT
ncbi:protein polyglycylase TTLL10 [Spinachia spinachia]